MKRNVMEYGNRNYKSDGKWNSVASKMVLRSEETGHPIFTEVSALDRGILRRVKEKKPYIHCGCLEQGIFIPNHSLSK